MRENVNENVYIIHIDYFTYLLTFSMSIQFSVFSPTQYNYKELHFPRRAFYRRDEHCKCIKYIWLRKFHVKRGKLVLKFALCYQSF